MKSGISFSACARLIILCITVSGCIFSSGSEKKEDTRPRVVSANFPDGTVFVTRDTTISWTGAGGATNYRYVLDGDSSSWIDTTTTRLTDLDEGVHALVLYARRDSTTGPPKTLTFTVDAVKGPAVTLSPRRISSAAYVTVTLEDADSLLAAHIELECIDSCARITAFEPSETYTGEGHLVTVANGLSTARLSLDIGFPGAGAGASGTFPVGRIYITPLTLAGTVEVDTLATEFRNLRNGDIPVHDTDFTRIVR